MRQSLRHAGRCVVAAIVAASLGGCADIAHTPDHVTTVLARESAAKPVALRNVAVVAIGHHITEQILGHQSRAALASNGNDRMDTLMPAIDARLPLALARAGLRAESVPYVEGHPDATARALARFGDVIEVTAASVSLQNNSADPSLTLNVRVLNHALKPMWVARLELRTDALPAGQRNDIRQWSEAMADDLAGLLVRQLVEDGFIRAPST